MTDAAHAEMFAALCKEVGFCLHPKGEKRVLEALPNGLDAATRAVLEVARARCGARQRHSCALLSHPCCAGAGGSGREFSTGF